MDKGYKLHRYGDNVEALLKKIEDFQENFILMKGCGDELVGGTRRCFFNFSYDDIATPVLADKAVFLSWEDRITNLPPVLASCSYVNLSVTGVTVNIDKGNTTIAQLNKTAQEFKDEGINGYIGDVIQTLRQVMSPSYNTALRHKDASDRYLICSERFLCFQQRHAHKLLVFFGSLAAFCLVLVAEKCDLIGVFFKMVADDYDVRTCLISHVHRFRRTNTSADDKGNRGVCTNGFDNLRRDRNLGA